MGIWHSLEAEANRLDQQHEDELAALRGAVDAALAERDQARQEFADHMATEHPVEPEPATDLAVRVFPQYADKTYGSHEAVLDRLGELGVKRISALLTPSIGDDEIAFYQNAFNRHGIKVWFAIGKPGVNLTFSNWERIRFLLSGPLADIVELASGWNEPNHQVSGMWEVPTANHQNALWTNVQQVNSATGQGIKVGTPPLWSGNVNEQYADLLRLAPRIQGSYDTINWHLYPHGNTGADLEALFDRQVDEFTAAYGDIPIVNSESGYSTSVNSSDGNPVTEEEQAEQLAALVAIHRARGIALSYFELLDDPDPTYTNREAHFGLFRCPSLDPSTWTRKPAFAVYRDLVLAA